MDVMMLVGAAAKAAEAMVGELCELLIARRNRCVREIGVRTNTNRDKHE
jgi:hypothetical protein